MNDSARVWNAPDLDNLSFFRAHILKYAFKRHVHDYFVIGLIEAGMQKFEYRRDTHYTPPTGVIILNPGEPHTGEAGGDDGFAYRAFYPEAEAMQQVASEVAGRTVDVPFFGQPVIHDAALYQTFRQFHQTVEQGGTVLEHESRYLSALAMLVRRHGDARLPVRAVKTERVEIQKLRRMLDERYAENIRLADLAALVNWNVYYMLRAFHKEVGLPPHAYLASVRVREAQKRLRRGMPIADVAFATGFNSQSHLTTTFKQMIGVTPGQYAAKVNF